MLSMVLPVIVITMVAAITDFDSFMVAFGRRYRNEEERIRRKNIFERNLAVINAHTRSSSGHEFSLAINEFADWTMTEYRLRNSHPIPQKALTRTQRTHSPMINQAEEADAAALPKNVDWRNHSGLNCVTPVQQQGSCNGCWAFAAVASLESMYCVRQHRLVKLSEQQLIDCYSPMSANFDQGCYGGFYSDPTDFFTKNGSCTEASYNYTSVHWNNSLPPYGTCRKKCSEGVPPGFVQGVEFVDGNLSTRERTMMELVAQHPIMVGVECDSHEFMFYKSGIISNATACGDQTDHAVIVVGYGTGTAEEHHRPYWIIKNSFGEGWGEEGYARLARGEGTFGMCGIAMHPAYITTK